MMRSASRVPENPWPLMRVMTSPGSMPARSEAPPGVTCRTRTVLLIDRSASSSCRPGTTTEITRSCARAQHGGFDGLRAREVVARLLGPAHARRCRVPSARRRARATSPTSRPAGSGPTAGRPAFAAYRAGPAHVSTTYTPDSGLTNRFSSVAARPTMNRFSAASTASSAPSATTAARCRARGRLVVVGVICVASGLRRDCRTGRAAAPQTAGRRAAPGRLSRRSAAPDRRCRRPLRGNPR